MCDVEGEALVETAQRELEEAGYRAGRIEHLCTYHGSAGFSDARLDIFLGLDLTPVATHSQSEEEHHMTVELVALEDTLELVASKAIIDAKTIIGLLLARERLGIR
jgi:ADP-ribose pyrophosphatase